MIFNFMHCYTCDSKKYNYQATINQMFPDQIFLCECPRWHVDKMNNLYRSRGPQNLKMSISTFVGKVRNYLPALKYKDLILSTGYLRDKKNQTKCHSKNTTTKDTENTTHKTTFCNARRCLETFYKG